MSGCDQCSSTMMFMSLVAPGSSLSRGGHQSPHSLEACLKKYAQKHWSRFCQKLDTTIAVTFFADSPCEVDLSRETSFGIASRAHHLEASNTPSS